VKQVRSWIAGTLTSRFVPEFRMLALDGQTISETTVWGRPIAVPPC
jgi:hypothetical protein